MSGTSWKLTAYASKSVVQAALLAHEEIEDWDFDLVISGREVCEDRPQEWVLEAWYPNRPAALQKQALAELFAGKTPVIEIEQLGDEDWLALSQRGVEPIRAGPFYVHTPEFDPDSEAIDFTIPAAQAFGTGQHETTAGCLEMLGRMRACGMHPRRVADIGTGTGLLGFAALALWPHASVTASDIDPICAGVIEDNADLNAVKLGAQAGAMTVVIADGMDNALLQMRGPYDLLIANILAGPLVDLAKDVAANVRPGGSVLLSGLLTGEQEAAVRRAYRRAGFRPAARMTNGDWAILWFRRRRRG